MHDLIGAYERIDHLYRLYIRSAFPLRSPVLSAERDRLLSRVGALSQPPLVEPVPVYESSGYDLGNATNRLPAQYADLAPLAHELFPAGRDLYRHQWQSLNDVLAGRDIVVTTGTGSGKTECFLLPLFAQLARESSTWPAPLATPTARRWWDRSVNPKGGRVGQWAHVTRPAALRAIVLYPLNALVEDQLRRLRLALDSNAVHGWLDEHRGGNRITFGRYTGLTPVSGRQEPQRRDRLRSVLSDLEEQRRQVEAAVEADPNRLGDALYYFPRVDGGEMWSRWDMQETAPDIMITNYSMLNIMMMRSLEESIFETTRVWLAEPGHPERQFSLIVDELHSYRGTPGTEVAYILRLLLARIGLTPDSPKLRIITTTASLEDDEKGRTFLREFFGRDRFAFISGRPMPPPTGARTSLAPYAPAFAEFARAVHPQPLDGPPILDGHDRAFQALTVALGMNDARSDKADTQLGEALRAVGAPEALRDASLDNEGNVRPRQAPFLDSQLFPEVAGPVGISDALRGLLLALSMSRLEATGRSAQPLRGHLFFHTLHNLWACCNPACDDAGVLAEDRDSLPSTARPPIGALHTSHRLICSCGSRVLDLIVCEVCGDVFLGGYRAEKSHGNQKLVILTADQPDLEQMPDRVNLAQSYDKYALFWPQPRIAGAEPVLPQDLEWEANKIARRWMRAKLNHTTGVLRVDAVPPTADEVPGWLYHMAGGKTVGQAAMPNKCPRCDSDYQHRRTFKTPLRNHRTGFQKAAQVLASALFREMGSDEVTSHPRSSRKLVIFSDSWQDAAKLAAGMERDHYRDILRLALADAFRSYWPDLVAFLRSMLMMNPAKRAAVLEMNPQLHTAVGEPSRPEDDEGRKRFQKAHPPEMISEALQWIMGMPSVNAPVREEWLSLLRAYSHGIPLRYLRGTVRARLLAIGMCPGGASSRALVYPEGEKQAREWKPWHACYRWEEDGPVVLHDPNPWQQKHLERMDVLLRSEIMFSLFSHMARTFEGLGQGRVGYRPSDDASPLLVSATEAVIRQFGVRQDHRYSDHYWAGDETRLRRDARRYVNNRGVTEGEVARQLLDSRAGIPGKAALSLDPDYLTLIPPPPGQESARLGYRCPGCNAFYLHNVGICPECTTPTAVVESTTTADFDYYTDLTEHASAAYFPMHCEELTGQTDSTQRPKRQRWFQDIFVGSEVPAVDAVDLLSVTTTMEAGVDIGALNAVMMANMPPRRFNYQQRVGRAGRRAEGVSLAVTFCRGRSHDDYYFQRPESITGDPPPSPYVDMSSEAIFKRVLIKEVLRQAFADTGSAIGVDGGDDVHGAFGGAVQWPMYHVHIAAWLQDPDNAETIEGILDVLLMGTYWAAPDSPFRDQMVSYLQDDLAHEVAAIAADPGFTQDALGERLANAGLLPMFGFPTRVRLLFTYWPTRAYPWPPDRGAIDRDLDIAISQFAPGSQTVKDKTLFTARGVVDLHPQGNTVISQNGFYPPLPEGNTHPLGICDQCQAVLVLDDVLLSPAGVTPERRQCPICAAPDLSLRILDAREPKGFFTDLEREDYEGQFEWQPRATRPSLSIKTKADVDVKTVANASVASTSDQILSINDNNGAGGFDFQGVKVDGQIKHGAFAVPSGDPEDDAVRVSTFGQRSWRVALLARRVTDILLVGIDTWPEGVFADPTTVVGRAAWYSFSFWLRLAAGAYLDVDPLELQAGFRSREFSGRPAGQAFLCDQLENGAGYCVRLGRADVFADLLAQADPAQLGSVAAKWTDNLAVPGTLPPHAIECDTSCNRCLRDFHNSPYHGLLDWRLALDMAHLATDPKAVLDLTTPWNAGFNPWATLLEGENAPIAATLGRLGYSDPVQFGPLRGYVHRHPARSTVLIEHHPLWQDDHPIWLTAADIAQSQYPQHQVEPCNPFIALRRPADYV